MIINAVCQNCGSSFELPYERLGTSMRCDNCHKYTIPVVPVGTLYPNTGYSISYTDFHHLVEYAPYRKKVGKLIKEWFDYSIVSDGQDIQIMNNHEESIDLLWLHLRIQASPDFQKRLYQTAMGLWR
jgi:hypothetical protein